jgi:hypothetical protein
MRLVTRILFSLPHAELRRALGAQRRSGAGRRGRLHPSAQKTRAGDAGTASDGDRGPTARVLRAGLVVGGRRGEAPV